MTDTTTNPIDTLTDEQREYCEKTGFDPLRFAVFRNVNTVEQAEAAEEFLANYKASADHE